jgi:hypothetical protein
MNPTFATQNGELNQKAYCAHCNNLGIVHLDGYPTVGAPCPMCKKGAAHDLHGWVAPDVQHFWTRYPVTTTWENGLTHRHTNRCRTQIPQKQHGCGKPSIGNTCDHHLTHPNPFTPQQIRGLQNQLNNTLTNQKGKTA